MAVAQGSRTIRRAISAIDRRPPTDQPTPTIQGLCPDRRVVLHILYRYQIVITTGRDQSQGSSRKTCPAARSLAGLASSATRSPPMLSFALLFWLVRRANGAARRRHENDGSTILTIRRRANGAARRPRANGGAKRVPTRWARARRFASLAHLPPLAVRLGAGRPHSGQDLRGKTPRTRWAAHSCAERALRKLLGSPGQLRLQKRDSSD